MEQSICNQLSRIQYVYLRSNYRKIVLFRSTVQITRYFEVQRRVEFCDRTRQENGRKYSFRPWKGTWVPMKTVSINYSSKYLNICCLAQTVYNIKKNMILKSWLTWKYATSVVFAISKTLKLACHNTMYINTIYFKTYRFSNINVFLEISSFKIIASFSTSTFCFIIEILINCAFYTNSSNHG